MEVLIIPLEDYKRIMRHESQTQQNIDMRFYLANLKPITIDPEWFKVAIKGSLSAEEKISNEVFKSKR